MEAGVADDRRSSRSRRERWVSLFDRARREVDERLPAVQLAVAKDGELVGFETFSRSGAETNDTRFLIWSCTKAVIAGVVWQLMGEGRSTSIARSPSYLPEFATNGKDVVTVEQLLLHTAGFPLAPIEPACGGRRARGGGRRSPGGGSLGAGHPRSSTTRWPPGGCSPSSSSRSTGNDYRDEVRRRITEPLGLADVAARRSRGRAGRHRRAVRHRRASGARGEHAASGVFYGGPPSVEVTPSLILTLGVPAAKAVGIPGGGAVSTAADVALYYQALLHNPDGLWIPRSSPTSPA